MRPEARTFLWDARQAAARVEEFVQGKGPEDYLADALLRSAVERQLEIVGEALNRLSRVDPQTAARIPDLARIVAFRNVLAHGYAVVDDRIVWDLVSSHLPALVAALQVLAAE
jgi:uncharacterized protein with HEPN domain